MNGEVKEKGDHIEWIDVSETPGKALCANISHCYKWDLRGFINKQPLANTHIWLMMHPSCVNISCSLDYPDQF
jgi:hypothetical protein